MAELVFRSWHTYVRNSVAVGRFDPLTDGVLLLLKTKHMGEAQVASWLHNVNRRTSFQYHTSTTPSIEKLTRGVSSKCVPTLPRTSSSKRLTAWMQPSFGVRTRIQPLKNRGELCPSHKNEYLASLVGLDSRWPCAVRAFQCVWLLRVKFGNLEDSRPSPVALTTPKNNVLYVCDRWIWEEELWSHPRSVLTNTYIKIAKFKWSADKDVVTPQERLTKDKIRCQQHRIADRVTILLYASDAFFFESTFSLVHFDSSIGALTISEVARSPENLRGCTRVCP